MIGRGLFHTKNVERFKAATGNMASYPLTVGIKYCKAISIPRVVLFCLYNESMATGITQPQFKNVCGPLAIRLNELYLYPFVDELFDIFFKSLNISDMTGMLD